ncbi:MAG: hypothetical protein AB2693_12680 [Candidatus Thiodiazotropha sp.]
MKEAQNLVENLFLTIRRRGLAVGESSDNPITISEDDDGELPPLSLDLCRTRSERIKVKTYFRRLEMTAQRDYIEKIALCNEFTAADLPHSHSHVYLVTKEKHLFKEVKHYMEYEFHVQVDDIQRPRDLIKACRYITKNDRQAIIYNIPLKHTSTTWRGYLYAQTHRYINWGHDIPASVAPCDRAIFSDVVKEEVQRAEDDNIIHRTDLELLGWQRDLIQILNNPEPGSFRLVYWIVDIVGHGGKSFMAQYLIRNTKGIIFNNFSHKDNAYLYNGEGIVVFDIPRDTPLEECSLQLLKDLKNGYLISQKYETRRKVFQVPITVVFSNSYPVKEKLSLDRWRVYHLMLLDENSWVLDLDKTYNTP